MNQPQRLEVGAGDRERTGFVSAQWLLIRLEHFSTADGCVSGKTVAGEKKKHPSRVAFPVSASRKAHRQEKLLNEVSSRGTW